MSARSMIPSDHNSVIAYTTPLARGGEFGPLVQTKMRGDLVVGEQCVLVTKTYA